MKFDYVIVGGGTCGLLLANRLSEDPNTTVAVIEPGQDVRTNPNVTDPANFLVAFDTPIDWAYPSIHQPGAANRTFTLHSGKALGGTSTINGMTYIRADYEEIDAWEHLGNTGWNWETLYPYYKRTEKFLPPTKAQVAAGAVYEPQYHGEDGALDVGFLYSLPNGSSHGIVQESWENLGYPINPDVNSGDTRGFSVWPMTVDGEEDLRWDAAQAYYYPVEGRANLHLLQGTGLRLIWNEEDEGCGKTAVGVQYINADNNKTTTVDVAKEAILSAGSLRTPLVLELSGVGNPNILGRLGIESVIDLPGVGEHLQDQPNSDLFFTGTLNVTGTPRYATFGTAEDIFGPNTSAIAASTNSSLAKYAEAVASASSDGLNATALEHIFRIQHELMFSKNVTIGETLTAFGSGYLLTAWWCIFPFSRGSVHLASADLDEIDHPVIDPRYFLADIDMISEIAIGKLAHDFFHTAPMKEYVISNASTDPSSNDEWAEYIAGSFGPNYHPIGTASMMARELGGVVDPELKVYGTSNVRVVDASVLPFQMSGHLTATLYAVAERASEMIKSCS